MIDLDRLQARVDNATPGPWVATEPNLWGDDYDILQSGVDVPGGSLTWDDHSGEVFKPEDAQFIAEAHLAVPELIRMVKELSQENEHLRAKYDEDMEQLRREQVGDLSVVTEKIDAVRYAINSNRVFRTSLGQPVIDVGYIWKAIGEGLE